MIAATRAVRVEVCRLYPMLNQVFAGRAAFFDGTGGRYVVRGDAVAKNGQHPRPFDVLHRSRLGGHVIKIGSAFDVSGVRLPGVSLAVRRGQVLPAFIAGEYGSVVLAKHLRIHAVGDCLIHLFLCRPEIAQVNWLALLVMAERVFFKINADSSRQRVRHHQRRRHEVIGANLRVDAPFKIAIATQHRSHHQAFVFDLLRYLRRQRSGVAYASHASVTNGVEAQLIHVWNQSGFAVVLGDHARPGRKGGLDPRWDLQSLLHRFLRQQTRGQHHRRV